jgi:hypothetical protein
MQFALQDIVIEGTSRVLIRGSRRLPYIFSPPGEMMTP